VDGPDDRHITVLMRWTAGTRLALTVLVCALLGYWADRVWQTMPILSLAGAVLGIALGLYVFIRESMRA